MYAFCHNMCDPVWFSVFTTLIVFTFYLILPLYIYIYIYVCVLFVPSVNTKTFSSSPHILIFLFNLVIVERDSIHSWINADLRVNSVFTLNKGNKYFAQKTLYQISLLRYKPHILNTKFQTFLYTNFLCFPHILSCLIFHFDCIYITITRL